jgi:hypothetical protein
MLHGVVFVSQWCFAPGGWGAVTPTLQAKARQFQEENGSYKKYVMRKVHL